MYVRIIEVVIRSRWGLEISRGFSRFSIRNENAKGYKGVLIVIVLSYINKYYII